MRVTGGKVKGTYLKVPQGQLIRPTTNLVKQAIFSILENTASSWHRILDLYAGSGALGIEALSRGVEWADFIDQRRRCCDIIKYNLVKAGFPDKAHVYCCKVSKAIAFLDNEYDIIFMDPPYSDLSISNTLMNLAGSKLVGESSVVVVCHSNYFSPSATYDGLCLIEQRYYGDTSVSTYRKEV